MRALRRGAVGIVAAAFALAGCNALLGNDEDLVLASSSGDGGDDVGTAPGDGATDSAVECQGDARGILNITPGVRTKIDLVFMVDNSASMLPKQSLLESAFPNFLQAFQDLAAQGTYADLHIGVVTSDMGAGPYTIPHCNNDQGKFQFGEQGDAGPTCAPPTGKPWIEYRFAAGSPVSNLPAGQDLAKTFTCMASVGENGCGFEQPLESVYQAVRAQPANAGFVRDDAVLVIVFVTDEDDGSTPPTADIFDPNPARIPQYGDLSSYRQTQFGVMCGNPPTLPPRAPTNGPLPGCVPATVPPGKQYDVQRYIDAFTKPNGVKPRPEDVMLFALMAPPAPFEVVLTKPGPTITPCSPYQQGTCIPAVQHACQNPDRADLFGDPAVRLTSVVKAARTHKIYSICDANYSGAVQDASQIIVRRDPGCVPFTLSDPDRPSCDVVDVASGGATTPIPSCATSAGATPCWRAEKKTDCADLSPQSLGITIDRGGKLAPPGTYARAACACTGAPPPVPPPEAGTDASSDASAD